MLWKEEHSPRVKKARKPTLRGGWESVFSGRHMDKVTQETHAVSVMTLWPLETRAVVRAEKGRSSSPASHSKTKRTDGEEQKASQGSSNKQENSERKE